MVFNYEDKLNDRSSLNNEDGEIDIKRVYDLLLRNKKLILFTSIAGVLLSGFLALATKRTWEGGFQIVLANENNVSTRMNSNLANIIGFDNNSNQLKTQVEILQSPSILINVFEFIKKRKTLEDKSAETLRFNDWKEDLEIQLVKGTTILSIDYRDQNKNNILPVLNMISKEYQEYSDAKRSQEIDLSLKYYDEQINLYKKKSYQSLKDAQGIAIENDLIFMPPKQTPLSGSGFSGGSLVEQAVPKSINTEIIRVQAANKIRLIDDKLKRIELTEKINSNDLSLYKSVLLESQELNDILKKLLILDEKIDNLSLNFKPDDSILIQLKKRRNVLLEIAKREAITSLNAQKKSALSLLKSVERPAEILIKYKQLLTKAGRDESTLENLQSQHRKLSLEKARRQKPWELITQPTLLPYPVAPRRKKYVAFGLLSGVLIGSVLAFVREKRKDIIYVVEEIQDCVNLPILSHFSLKNNKSKEESLSLLASGPLAEINDSFALLPVGNIDNLEIDEILSYLKESLNTLQINIVNDLGKVSKYKQILLVTSLCKTRKKDLTYVYRSLMLQKTSVIGLIVISDVT